MTHPYIQPLAFMLYAHSWPPSHRPMLDFRTASSIVHSKLDLCNSIFVNLESTKTKRRQLMQNSLARCHGLLKASSVHHVTLLLKSLHWPKVQERIHFKVLSLIYITAPRLWNDLPPELRTLYLPLPSLPVIKHHLHPTPQSITPRAFYSKLKCYPIKNS